MSYLSINGNTIRQRGDKPIRIARSPSDAKPAYANEVEILDAAGNAVARLVYDPERRIMRCGARLVLETDTAVRIVR